MFQREQSALNVTQGHKRSNQTSSLSINAKSLGTISACMFQQELITSNNVIKAESQPTNLF